MFRFLALLCTALFSVGSSSARDGQIMFEVDGVSRELYSSSEALVIFGSQYIGGWDNLNSVPAEMNRLVEVLKTHNFNVTLLPNAKGAEIEATVKAWIAEHGQDNKRLLIYYAGHGWVDENHKGYLVPVDAPLPNVNRLGFRKVAISEGAVRGWADSIGSRHALFIFDSCFAGAMFGKRGLGLPPSVPGSKMTRGYFDGMLPENVTFMSATDAVTEVPASSAFTSRLIGGLQGAADTNNDGYIISSELGEWIKYEFLEMGTYKPRWGSVGDRWSDYGMVFVSPRGRQTAQLRPYQSRPVRLAALQAVGAPTKALASDSTPRLGKPTSALSRNGWFVRYYEKDADTKIILPLLDELRVAYLALRPEVPSTYPTNAIACHPNSDVEGVKTLALKLHDAGIVLKAIIPFKPSAQGKPVKRLEIISLATPPERLRNVRPLT